MRELVLAHSSDLHLGWQPRPVSLAGLKGVLDAALEAHANVLVLVGDVFDHNRVPPALVNRAAALLADRRLPTVILPGNHDPLGRGSVYCWSGLGDVPNLHVIGLHSDEPVVFPGYDLEIWGRPHRDYRDMAPLGQARERASARYVVLAHGHWVEGPHDEHRSWLIRAEDIEATGADYVALGHWDRAVQVGRGRVPAYYSGSPDMAKSINVVQFGHSCAVKVSRRRLPDLVREDDVHGAQS